MRGLSLNERGAILPIRIYVLYKTFEIPMAYFMYVYIRILLLLLNIKDRVGTLKVLKS